MQYVWAVILRNVTGKSEKLVLCATRRVAKEQMYKMAIGLVQEQSILHNRWPDIRPGPGTDDFFAMDVLSWTIKAHKMPLLRGVKEE